MKTKQISLSLKVNPYHIHTTPFYPLSPSYPKLYTKQSSLTIEHRNSVFNHSLSTTHSKPNRLVSPTSNHFHTLAPNSSHHHHNNKHSMSHKNVSNSVKKFCFVNKRLLVNQLSKDVDSTYNGNVSYNKQYKQMSFCNQTLSSLYKIDHTMFRLNNKLKKEIEKNLFDNPKYKNTVRNVNGNEKGLSSYENVMDKLNSFIKLTQEKMGVDKRQPINYLRLMEKELKKGIKKHDGYVKETIGSLRRLQMKNDENLTKNTFIKKTMFK